MLLDSEGTPYVSYYDSLTGVLKVAHLNNDKWVYGNGGSKLRGL